MDSSCQLKTTIESSMVGIVQSDCESPEEGWGGELCGCAWQSKREMWYIRSKLQQQLSVGKTFSGCLSLFFVLFCGGKVGAREAAFLQNRHLLKAVFKNTLYPYVIRTMSLTNLESKSDDQMAVTHPVFELASQWEWLGGVGRRCGQSLLRRHVGRVVTAAWG